MRSEGRRERVLPGHRHGDRLSAGDRAGQEAGHHVRAWRHHRPDRDFATEVADTLAEVIAGITMLAHPMQRLVVGV